ncbi:hypothetical protein OO17_25505 [Rhodopseudomonas palustris]|uniref:Uncharacterized protein n=1 Tax=Rhodopseudomonas palustris TaxID=1076 RepID=A0A0D7E4D7_RHOPL|nr:hypothetical protein OO17_25505 [Rhodopseudomonas palustris]
MGRSASAFVGKYVGGTPVGRQFRGDHIRGDQNQPALRDANGQSDALVARSVIQSAMLRDDSAARFKTSESVAMPRLDRR